MHADHEVLVAVFPGGEDLALPRARAEDRDA